MPPLPILVFVVGTGSLGAEIATARLLAPYFGASTIVWANTIGIVLVALSIGYWYGGSLPDRTPTARGMWLGARAIGYWYGGRLADRNPTREGLYRIVLLSGVLLAAVPFIADP